MTDGNLTRTSANYDWGVYNAISNGGNKASMWRTLTSSEWCYLFNTRTNAQYLWSQGKVNGVNGVIILPDNFSKPSSISWTPQATNTYSTEQWSTLQAIGAVFLPAAGSRDGQDVRYVQNFGIYWSSTADNQDLAYCLYFVSSLLLPQNFSNRFVGFSVRLVQDL